MREELTAWLLEGPPWVQYRTRLDLLGQAEDDPPVSAARETMLAHPQIQGLVRDVQAWPGSLLKSHKQAGHPIHKLTFLADLGLRAGDPGMDRLVDRIMAHQSPEGPFQVLVNIHPRYGGAGQDQWAWMLCDAPLVIYALIKFGLGQDARVRAALDHLAGLITQDGWPCVASSNLGRFRGPGRKTDPCPYANLVMLKALAQSAQWRDAQPARTGAETVLDLWDERKERRPYLFAMGTDFAKLKAPMVWYDILHVLDVLAQFPWLQDDSRLRHMAHIVEAKGDELGRVIPDSVWMAWRDWDFGQKRRPSEWLTLLAGRSVNRLLH